MKTVLKMVVFEITSHAVNNKKIEKCSRYRTFLLKVFAYSNILMLTCCRYLWRTYNGVFNFSRMRRKLESISKKSGNLLQRRKNRGSSAERKDVDDSERRY